MVARVLRSLFFVFLNFTYFYSDVAFSDKAKSEEDRHCGKISGEVFKFSEAYFFFWANYEGKSDWEPGFTNNKKGCDSNFVAVSLEFYWPVMTPAGHTTVVGDKKNGHVELLIEPLNEGNDGRLADRYLNSAFERYSIIPLMEPDHHPDLDLYFVDANSENSLISLYWDEAEGRVQTFIECESFRSMGPYMCSQVWYFKRLNSVVGLNYRPTMLKYWRRMRDDAERFIMSHHRKIKEGVNK